jgi:tetratricopeptide (TPR) repeat protein
MTGNIIEVQDSWSEHTYIAQQRCSCGGSYGAGEWILDRQSDQWVEVCKAQCMECGAEAEFRFDVSAALEAYAVGGDEFAAFTEWWPAPRTGPYAVREQEYTRRVDALLSRLESGTLSLEDYERECKAVLDECHPKIAGRYQVFGWRRGSMGVVYWCQDSLWVPSCSAPYFVACKTLDASAHASSIDALEREARIWLQLASHPNVVQLLDVASSGESLLVLVMELVLPGPSGRTTLRDWLDANAVDQSLVPRLLTGLCRAMCHCRRNAPGFVHGDLKPENLLVDVGYTLKVTDFGLARASGYTGPLLGKSLGTPRYLAPECWEGDEPTEKSDVYAAGLITYEMLAGRHPYARFREVESLRRMHLTSQIPRLGHPVPAWLANLVVECVAKEPIRRPTFGQLLAALEQEKPPEGRGEMQMSAGQWTDRGRMLMELGQPGDALECYQRAIDLDPTSPVVWGNLAVLYSRLRLHEQAGQAYLRCFELGADYAQLNANYAAHLLRTRDSERYGEGVSFCDRALEQEPGNVTAMGNKAALLNGLGRYAEAAEVAQKAVSIDPGQPKVLFTLGEAYLRMGRRSKALKCAKKALKLDPGFERARALIRLAENRPG